ncbi:hypothetical protein CLIB1423_24S00232 [[Candida] railenensis]|uniref:Uncharacterized protein n=1 Tax=[Candida] railenensis TaxID=45579 RepID=A0A9P0QUX1_9ASCO|nr:hypothetical protein CLIB1423_24S00232 [[Candida] railenensis]
MPVFELRKFSKLLNPSSTESSWHHHPERSELYLSFEALAESAFKVKVLWRYTIFEQAEFTTSNSHSPSGNTLTVRYKQPSLSFKFIDPTAENKILRSRFQVSFYTNEEFAKCLKYLEDIEVYTRKVSAPSISSETNSQFQADTHSQTWFSQSQTWQESQSSVTRHSLLPPTQEIPSYGSGFQFPMPRQMEQQKQISNPSSKNNSIIGTDLSLLGDLTFGIDTTTESNFLPIDIRDTSDDILKGIILKTLDDPKFLEYCERVDDIVRRNGL